MRRLGQAGDTIIEVMLSATVLALILSVAFVSANRSLSTGTDAASRAQATQYASQQIEFLHTVIDQAIATGNNSVINPASPPAGEFCLYLDASNNIARGSAGRCNQGQFTIGVRYNWDYINNQAPAQPTSSYSAYASWEANASSHTNQVVLYYQEPK